MAFFLCFLYLIFCKCTIQNTFCGSKFLIYLLPCAVLLNTAAWQSTIILLFLGLISVKHQLLLYSEWHFTMCPVCQIKKKNSDFHLIGQLMIYVLGKVKPDPSCRLYALLWLIFNLSSFGFLTVNNRQRLCVCGGGGGSVGSNIRNMTNDYLMWGFFDQQQVQLQISSLHLQNYSFKL